MPLVKALRVFCFMQVRERKGEMRNKVLAVACVMALSLSWVWADEPEIDLDKIVVTPYKTSVEIDDSPASVDVISASSALSNGKYNLTDTLKDLSSLDYATSGGIAGETSFFIRGANPEHTQVLMDGIKLYDPISTAGYFYAYNYMGLDELDKIEVSKGPYSTLYGSGSIGGTINMVTKKGTGKPKFSYTQELGSYNTFREKISSDGAFEKAAYSFSLTKSDINSFYSARYKNGNHERDPYHDFSGLGRLDYAITDSLDLNAVLDYTYAKYEYDGSSWTPPYLPTDDDFNHAKFYQGIGYITGKHKLSENFSHKLTFGYTRTKRLSWESDSGDSWYDGKTYQGKWEGDYNLTSWDTLTFGYDYLKEIGEGFGWSTREPKKHADTSGGYLQNIIQIKDALFISASYRIEDHSKFGETDTYSISGSYRFKPTNTKIKASYGKGFKAPSLYQLYSSYGDPNLTPEISKSYEVGVEQKCGIFKLESTYFNTKLSNLVDYDSASWKYINSGKAHIDGIENSLTAEFNENLNAKISYTYMDARKNSDDSRLLRRPKNKISCNLNAKIWNKLEFIPEVSYVGDRIDSSAKLKSYILLNLTTRYKLNEHVKTFLRFENILNKDYQLISGYETPKFSGYAGLTLDF